MLSERLPQKESSPTRGFARLLLVVSTPVVLSVAMLGILINFATKTDMGGAAPTPLAHSAALAVAQLKEARSGQAATQALLDGLVGAGAKNQLAIDVPSLSMRESGGINADVLGQGRSVAYVVMDSGEVLNGDQWEQSGRPDPYATIWLANGPSPWVVFILENLGLLALFVIVSTGAALTATAVIKRNVNQARGLNRGTLPVDNLNDPVRPVSKTAVGQGGAGDLEKWTTELEVANSIKDEFIANISHEVRTPLNSIIGFASLLQQSNLEIKQLEFVDRILESSEALSGLMSDILEYSVLDTGVRPSVQEDMDLMDELERVIQASAERAYDKGLYLDLIVDHASGSLVRADRIAVTKVVSRLVDNAIKFSEAGGVVVRASVDEGAGGANLRISVSDTGMGIPESVHSFIFEGFTQGESANTKSQGGLGIGLSVIKKMVELAGGGLEFRSEEGAGTIFEVMLPCTQSGRVSKKQQAIIHDRDLASADTEIFVLAARDSHRESVLGKVSYLNLTATALDENSAAPAGGGYLLADSATLSSLDVPAIRMKNGFVRIIALCDSVDDAVISNIESQPGVDIALPAVTPAARLGKCLVSAVAAPAAFEFGDFSMPDIPEVFMQPLSGIHVLSVDDNHINQQLMRITLEQLGATVTEAHHGRHALDMCSTQSFDIILMDHQMPKMTGTECVSRIRAECMLNKNTPIVGLTANISQGLKNSDFRRVVDDVFVKPLDNNEVVATITACIFRRRGGAHADTR